MPVSIPREDLDRWMNGVTTSPAEVLRRAKVTQYPLEPNDVPRDPPTRRTAYANNRNDPDGEDN